MDDPLRALDAWRAEAARLEVIEPDAMALATATPEGRPAVRMVLLRGIAGRELHFFTNYESRKADEIQANPWAAAVFFWSVLKRQVRVEGPVSRLPAERSDAYFASRPRGHQLAAWASPQSRPIESLEVLARRVEELDRRFAGGPVPRPPGWGGYALLAERVELWIGGADRLHERQLYVWDGATWTRQQLAP